VWPNGIEAFGRKVYIIEVGNDNAHATLKLLEFPLANVRLRPRIGHAQDFDAAPAGKIIGRGA
jgi:hypothetical protein